MEQEPAEVAVEEGRSTDEGRKRERQEMEKQRDRELFYLENYFIQSTQNFGPSCF